MRIGIDVRYLSHGLIGGVHTYVRNLVPALIEHAAEHTIILYADTKRPFELDNLPAHVQLRLLPYHSPLSSAANDALMWRSMTQDHLDVVHFPANYGFGPPRARTVITLHDELTLIPLHRVLRGKGTPRTPRLVAMTSYLYVCTHLALRRAHLLITDSAHARRQIMAHCSFDPGRIVPIHLAPSPELRRVDDLAALKAVQARYALGERFVLADGLKNPNLLVKAWRRLPAELRSGRKIVFFSRRPDTLPIVQEAISAGEAQLVVRAPRPDLNALYSMAEAFVFPSWIEGFGLPVLEAMICGTPVIASDRGSIPEVAGEAALLVDAADDAGLAEKLARVLGDPTEGDRLRRLGFARAQRFSWKNAALHTLDAYQHALQVSPTMYGTMSGVNSGR